MEADTAQKEAAEAAKATAERPKQSLSDLVDSVLASSAPLLSPIEQVGNHWLLRLAYPLFCRAHRRMHRTFRNSDTDWSEVAIRNSYLDIRLPLPIANNYFFLLRDNDACKSGFNRAVKLIWAAAEFYRRTVAGELQPDLQGDVQLDMTQYRRSFFATSRIPKKGTDKLCLFQDSSCAVVLYRGSAFRVELFHDGELISPHLIERQLSSILRNSSQDKFEIEDAIGVGTALDRDLWARIRSSAEEDFENKKSLQIVDRALFVVALDLDFHPSEIQEAAEFIRHGDFSNRWHEKSFQLIIFGNGKAGIQFEHSAIDGLNASRFARDITEFAEQDPEFPANGANYQNRLEPLYWKLPSHLKPMVCDAIQELRTKVNDRKVETFDIPREVSQCFGKNEDSPIQLAIQWSAREILGEIPGVNGAVHMKHFQFGRYDTIFCVTSASMDFILSAWSVLEDAQKPAKLVTKDKLKRKMDRFVQEHRALIKACKLGMSPVLYYSALLAMQEPNDWVSIRPDGIYLFKNKVLPIPGIERWLNCKITTSNLGDAPGVEVFGFTDALPEVLGIAYMLKKDRIQFNIKWDRPLRNSLEDFKSSLVKNVRLLHKLGG